MTDTNRPAQGRRIVLRRWPQGLPTAADFSCEYSSIGTPGRGEILVRTLWVSIDGFMVSRIKPEANYAPGVEPGQVMQAYAIGRVEESCADGFEPGDYVFGPLGMQEWVVARAEEPVRKVVAEDLPHSLFLGLLGISGWTAHVGLYAVGQLRAGETVLVSAGAGGVGAVVGQLASLNGARAVAIVGSDEKIELAEREFGYAAAVNRKASDFALRLAQACPNGVDVYFDNVGGELYEQVLEFMNVAGRIVVCGRLANAGLSSSREDIGRRDHNDILVKRLRKQGFVVTDYADQFEAISSELAQWWREGRISLPEDVAEGIESCPEALIRLLQGDNRGKQLVRIMKEI